MTVAASRRVWRRARTLASAAREAACLPGSGQLVVVEGSAAEAFAVPGRPGRIVVSAGCGAPKVIAAGGSLRAEPSAVAETLHG